MMLSKLWWQQLGRGLLRGLLISLAVGVYVNYVSHADKVDSLVYPYLKAIFVPQPKGVALGDWYFGCRKARDCP